MLSRVRVLLAALAILAGVAACVPAASQPVRLSDPARVLLGPHNDTSTPFNLVSVPALIRHRYDGRGFRLEEVLTRELSSTRYRIGYRSGDLRISGVMTVPNRPGRHPVIVLAHGWAAPGDYTTGSGLVREQSFLAASGYVVLQPDYRNYADSDRERRGAVAKLVGYPEDVINAVRALRAAKLPIVDASRVGLFGRSMGGGVVYNALVARPHLARALVLYSPVSSVAADNYGRWVADDPALRHRVVTAYGTPEDDPRFWRQASVRSYLDRVAVPVQIDHGTADPVCPVRWSRATAAALHAVGKDVTLHEYPGEAHRFDRSWPRFMHRAVRFLRAELG